MAAKKKKKAVPAPVMYGYGIELNHHCDHEEHSDEPYGDWSSSFTNSINPNAIRNAELPDAVAPFDIPAGQNALVVWAEWSSGDSFGHGERNCTEVIGIFQDLRSASDLRDKLLAHKKGDTDRGYDITTPDGQHFKCGYISWNGYFESLDEIHIDTVTVW